MQTDMKDRLEAPDALDSARDPDGPVLAEADIDAAPAPDWFRGKAKSDPPKPTTAPSPPKLKHPGTPKRRARIVDDSQPPEEPRDWRGRMLLWLGGFAATGYGVSLLFHTAILVGLGLWFLDLQSGPAGSVTLGFSEDDAEGFDFGPDDSLFEEAGGKDTVEEPTPVELVSQKLFDEGDPVEETKDAIEKGVQAMLPSTGSGEGNDDGDGTNENSGGGRKLGSNAVTKGSFTVRVTPTRELLPGESIENFDPKPGEAYFIYIYVALPEDVAEITVNDIDGYIEGTDGWRTQVPFHPNKIPRVEGETTYYMNPRSRNRRNPFTAIGERDVERAKELPIIESGAPGHEGRAVVLRIRIPPPVTRDEFGREVPARGIEDSIHVRCKPLDEKQEFQIVF